MRQAAPEQIAALYGLRWRVEGDIKDVKQELQMHRLDGRGVEMVDKEILLGMVACNLVIRVRWRAARHGGTEPRKLSFKRILDLVQAFCDGSGASADPAEIRRRYERLTDAALHCRLPVRRHFRSYPREVIPRTRGFPFRRISSAHKNQVALGVVPAPYRWRGHGAFVPRYTGTHGVDYSGT
jgi:hypothetical protein